MLVIQNVFQKIRNTQKKKKKNKQTPNGVYIYNCVIWTLRNYNHLLQYYNVHEFVHPLFWTENFTLWSYKKRNNIW